MMKFLFFIMFLIPLNFYKSMYWLIQNLFLLMFIMFMINFKMSYFSSIGYGMFCDKLSWLMILLSMWIISLMMMASFYIFTNKVYLELFMFMVIILMLSLYLTFSVSNMFMFYLFFEMSLIPILFMIIGWGYQPERLQAGMYMLFYTLLASLPMMIFLFKYYYLNYSLSFIYIMKMSDYYLLGCMIMVFLVKMPMYLFHLWLPKAHVEAPVAGSMILAGILLKLGGYGLMRFLMIFINLLSSLNYIMMIISLWGGVIISFICIRQVDMKSLIAYSSVAHMGLVLAGLFTMNLWGFIGSLIMMIAHGLCSSGLFVLANFNYERLHSRSMFLNKGMMNFMPSLSLYWFLLCSSNMAAPPSLNLMGEMMLINSLVFWSKYLMMFIMIMSFFSAIYSLFLYSFNQHGMLNFFNYSFIQVSIREYLLILLHWLPLNMLFMKSELLFNLYLNNLI